MKNHFLWKRVFRTFMGMAEKTCYFWVGSTVTPIRYTRGKGLCRSFGHHSWLGSPWPWQLNWGPKTGTAAWSRTYTYVFSRTIVMRMRNVDRAMKVGSTASLLCVCRRWPAAHAGGLLRLMNLPNEPVCAKVPTGPGINRIYTWLPGKGGNLALGAGQRLTWLPTCPLLRVGGWDVFLRNSRQGMKELSNRMPALPRCLVDVRQCRITPHVRHTVLIFPTKTTEANRRRAYNI